MTRAVSGLLAVAAQVVPAPAGTMTVPGAAGTPWHRSGRDELAALLHHWTASHPEAGLHYRRSDGERCSTCPRRTRPERIACLNLE